MVPVMSSGIYRIDLGNGWFYIGSAVNLMGREAVHRSTLKHGKHSNIKVQRCWNKYRVFVFNVLETCEKSELISREQFYLDKYFNNKKNTNIAPTAGSTLGRVFSDETKAKMSEVQKGKKGYVRSAETLRKLSSSQKGRIISPEHRAKLSNANKGKTLSIETRKKISAAGKGRVFSDEHRAKISAAHKGKVHSVEHHKKVTATKKLRREQSGQ
jgi:group I intron endonuclease